MKLAYFTTYTNRTEVKEGNSTGNPALWRSSEEDAVGAGGLEGTDVAPNQQREPAYQ